MKKRISGLDGVRAADFTSLLDVFMILLFIVMIRHADRCAKDEQQFREQTEAQNAQIEMMRKDAAEAREESEMLRSIAEGKQAAGEYFTLINITVYSAYDERKIIISGDFPDDSEEFILKKGGEERTMRAFADKLAESVSEADGGIVMIVFSYDSRKAYRQDIMNISSEIGTLERKYDNIYLRERNTAEERE